MVAASFVPNLGCATFREFSLDDYAATVVDNQCFRSTAAKLNLVIRADRQTGRACAAGGRRNLEDFLDMERCTRRDHEDRTVTSADVRYGQIELLVSRIPLALLYAVGEDLITPGILAVELNLSQNLESLG